MAAALGSCLLTCIEGLPLQSRILPLSSLRSGHLPLPLGSRLLLLLLPLAAALLFLRWWRRHAPGSGCSRTCCHCRGRLLAKPPQLGSSSSSSSNRACWVPALARSSRLPGPRRVPLAAAPAARTLHHLLLLVARRLLLLPLLLHQQAGTILSLHLPILPQQLEPLLQAGRLGSGPIIGTIRQAGICTSLELLAAGRIADQGAAQHSEAGRLPRPRMLWPAGAHVLQAQQLHPPVQADALKLHAVHPAGF